MEFNYRLWLTDPGWQPERIMLIKLIKLDLIKIKLKVNQLKWLRFNWNWIKNWLNENLEKDK